MKTISAAITAIALTLTGCAHTGYYQQSYPGYSTGYGGYTTVDRYYGTPSSSYYYQPGSVYGYEYYSTPGYGSHHQHRDHDRDNDRYNDWRSGGYGRDHHRGSNLSGDNQHDTRDRWNWNGRQRQDGFDNAFNHGDQNQHGHNGGSDIGTWQGGQNNRHSRNFSDSVPRGMSGDSPSISNFGSDRGSHTGEHHRGGRHARD